MAATPLTSRVLRAHAVARSLFPPTGLAAAIDRMSFVQADPIRSPARAQDLILRHRVVAYRSGDLERDYASLDVEEDYLYAYGFVARHVWNLLHPRVHSRMRAFEQKVLDTVRRLEDVHPAALEPHLGRKRVVNAWGGYSKATTQALEELHYRGLVRIVRREAGIRVYRPSSPPAESTSAADRMRALAIITAGIFAPAPEKSLQTVIARYRNLGSASGMIAALVTSGELRREVVDGMSYVWPAADHLEIEETRRVRFLAPFDPVVWDRVRFEHLWGWAYRFEAYTPVAKRIRGYYAMPMFWGNDCVGWVNASAGTRALEVKVGFAGKRPREAAFARELDAEIARLDEFLRS